MKLVDIPFIHGQDEQIDPKIAPAGVLKSARNVRRTKDGRWSKRNGYTALATTTVQNESSSNVLTNTVAVRRRRDELLAISARSDTTVERINTYNAERSRWQAQGYILGASAPSRTPVPNQGSQSAKRPDSAVTNGFLCVVYDSTTQGRVFVTIYNLATGAVVYSAQHGGSSGQERPKVVACGNVFCITWIDTAPAGNNEIEFLSFNTASGATVSATIATNMLNTSTYYDTCPFDSTQFLVIYNHSNGASINVVLYNTSGTLTDSVNFAATPGMPTVFGTSGENVTAAWHVGNDIIVQTFDSSLTAVVGPTTVNTDASNQLMPAIARKDANNLWILWSGDDATNIDTFTRWRTLHRTTHALGTLVTVPGVRLASKPLYTSGVMLAWLVTKSTFDRVYSLVAMDDALGAGTRGPMTTLARAEAVDFVTADGFSSLVASGTTIYHSFPRIARGLVSSATPFTNIDWASVDLFGDERFQAVEVNGTLYLSGGMLMAYDGDVQDLGFPVAPTINSLVASNSTGTLTSSSTYQYVTTLEWHDAAGNRWQSVPSDPVSVTLGATDDTVVVHYARPRLNHLKGNTGASRYVATHIWRTLANGTQFQRVTDDTGLLELAGSSTASENTLTDTTPDSTLRSNEIIYTQGQRGGLSGILEHSPGPPCRYIWTGRDRVIVGGLENRSEVRWSKRFYPGEPLNFSNTDGFKQLVPGTVTAVAELDGVWIVFTEREIYAVTGDGPDDNGAGASFSPPQRIPSDVGCINWRSVVPVPHGLLFQASKDRIYLLPRGAAAPVWIGQPVKGTLAALEDDAEITGAELLAEQNVVLFTVTDGTTGLVLVYDTRTGEWTVDADNDNVHFTAGVTSWNGDAVLATGTTVYQQSAAFADTGGDFIGITLETGELRPGGLNSNVRVRKAAVLGEYRGACQLKLELSVDDGLTYPHSVTWTLSGLSTGEQVQRVWRLPVQKFGSCKFKVSDLTNGSATEGVALHGLTLEVEGRKGMPRLREAYRG